MEILCPILLCIAGLGVSQVDIRRLSKPQKMNISMIGKQSLLFGKFDNIDIDQYHFTMFNVTSETLNFGSYNDKKEAINGFMDAIYDKIKDKEDSINHEVDMMAKNYEGHYGGLILLNDSINDFEFIEVINPRVKHGIPLYTYFFMKKIIEIQSRKSVDIEYIHYPLPLTAELEEQRDSTNNTLVVFFVAIAFALIPANFITIIIKEKINNSKHLMRVSGINIFAYWLVNFIFECVKYYFTCGICVLLLLAFDFYKDYLYILYICYGPAIILLTYLLSFIFETESQAQNGVILLNFLLGALGATVILILRALENTKILAKVLQYIISLLPSFCFNFGFDLLLNKIMIYAADYPNEWFFFKDIELLKRFNLLLSNIVFLVAEFFVYSIILAVIECCAYRGSNVPDQKIESNNINDSQVLKEIDLANENNVGVTNENGESNKVEYAVRK